MISKPEILIVGGGVAGLSLATRLGKSMGKHGKARITLIDKSFSHVWKPMLHCFASGTMQNENDRINFISQASGHNFEFWPGEVVSIDRVRQEVVLSPLCAADGTVVLESRTIKYDTIVIASGSGENEFGTPGVRENCLSIDNLVEAKELKDKIVAEAKQHAQTEGARLIEDAKREIDEQKLRALAEVKSEVSSLSLDIARKVLTKEFADQSKQESLVADLLKDVKLS